MPSGTLDIRLLPYGEEDIDAGLSVMQAGAAPTLSLQADGDA